MNRTRLISNLANRALAQKLGSRRPITRTTT
jgi:hypothetical protein